LPTREEAVAEFELVFAIIAEEYAERGEALIKAWQPSIAGTSATQPSGWLRYNTTTSFTTKGRYTFE